MEAERDYPEKGDALTRPKQTIEYRLYLRFFKREPANANDVHLTNYEYSIVKLERAYEAHQNYAVQRQADIDALHKRLKKIRKALKGM